MKNNIVLVEMFVECGCGEFEGLFVCDEDRLPFICGKDIYFGEILGPHSEVDEVLSLENFCIKSNDATLIKQLLEIFGPTIAGHNPWECIQDKSMGPFSEESKIAMEYLV